MVEVATLRGLLATAPAAFVAARNDLAKQLRADGDREGADAVKALRRLGVSDWALNVAAGEDADASGSFADAAVDVLDAQVEAMEGRGGGDLRTRLKTLRARSAELVGAAAAVAERHGQRGTGSSSLDIGARLTEIAGNRAAIDLLRDGLIGAADPGIADPFGVVGVGRSSDRAPAKDTRATTEARRAPVEDAKAPKTAKPSGGEAAQPNELARRRVERRARGDAEQAAKAAASELSAAEAVLAKSRTVAKKAADRVADAEARLAEAVEARDRAEAAVADAEANQRRATDVSERARAALSSER